MCAQTIQKLESRATKTEKSLRSLCRAALSKLLLVRRGRKDELQKQQVSAQCSTAFCPTISLAHTCCASKEPGSLTKACIPITRSKEEFYQQRVSG